MATKSVQVTFSTSDYDSDLLNTHRLGEVLRVYLNGTTLSVDDVSAIRPPATTKIGAIKAVRGRHGLALRDAKLLVDLAQERGEVRWGESTVIYFDHTNPSGEQYVVMDDN